MTSPTPVANQDGRRIGLLRVVFDRALAEILEQVEPAHPALRPAHLQLFREAGVDGSSAAELAAHAGMTKQSMHELLAHLEQHRYLTRRPDPADSRTKLVRLTAKGRRLEGQIHAAVADVQASWEERLGSRRFEALWATLRELSG
jgi:DNA-binding MarR family transcriptional regulator